MKTKKGFVILIAVFFVFALIVSSIALFSVKKIDIQFNASENTAKDEVINTLNDKFGGENLIFLNLDKVKDSLFNYVYFEVLSVQKKYPNILSVSLKERRETYFIKSEDKIYVCSEDGILLRVIDEQDFNGTSRSNIYVELEELSVLDTQLGTKILSTDDELLNTVFDMSKSVNLADCIKSIKIVDSIDDLVKTATFTTYTGVEMTITRPTVMGVEKIQSAFSAYDGATDYIKSYNNIVVSYNEGASEIIVSWTEKGEV